MPKAGWELLIVVAVLFTVGVLLVVRACRGLSL